MWSFLLLSPAQNKYYFTNLIHAQSSLSFSLSIHPYDEDHTASAAANQMPTSEQTLLLKQTHTRLHEMPVNNTFCQLMGVICLSGVHLNQNSRARPVLSVFSITSISDSVA